jgi:hypothetical protein
VVSSLDLFSAHYFVAHPAPAAGRSLLAWAASVPGWANAEEAKNITVLGCWTMPGGSPAALASLLAGKIEALWQSPDRRAGIEVGTIWETAALPGIRHPLDLYPSGLPAGADPGHVVHVVEGDQNPIMVPYLGLQVGRHALLGRLLIVGADKVRIVLPERELVREQGVVLESGARLRSALDQASLRRARQPNGQEQEGPDPLDEALATAIGLCLLAAEYHWAAPLWPKDVMDQTAYEQVEAVRRRYDPYHR